MSKKLSIYLRLFIIFGSFFSLYSMNDVLTPEYDEDSGYEEDSFDVSPIISLFDESFEQLSLDRQLWKIYGYIKSHLVVDPHTFTLHFQSTHQLCGFLEYISISLNKIWSDTELTYEQKDTMTNSLHVLGNEVAELLRSSY